MRQLKKIRPLAAWIPVMVVGLVSAGCQQPSGPGAPPPLMPANPMSGPTRIPPPPTGSIGGTNSYTQPLPMNGQVSAGLRVNDLVAATAASPPPAAAAPGSSGVLAAGTAAANGSIAPSPVQQVGFQPSRGGSLAAAPRQLSAGTMAAPPLAPTIPADAMTASSYVDTSTPFRPQLRGMQAIDLTPTDPPSLRPVDSGNWTVVGENPQGNRANFPSTQAAVQSSSRFSGTQAASPQTPAQTNSAADSSLQWRRPQLAR